MFRQLAKSGSGVAKHCINVATDETTSEATDHMHPELTEWQEDSIYDRDDSKAKLATLKDGMTMASSYNSIFISCTLLANAIL